MWRGSDDWCGIIVSGTTLEGKRFRAADSRTPSFKTRRDAESWIKKANDATRVPGVSYFLVEDVEDRESTATENPGLEELTEEDFIKFSPRKCWYHFLGPTLDEKGATLRRRHEEIRQAEREYFLGHIAQFRKLVQKTTPAREAIRAKAEKSEDRLFHDTWTRNFGLCLNCPYFGLQATEDRDCQGECGARPALTKSEGKILAGLVIEAMMGA